MTHLISVLLDSRSNNGNETEDFINARGNIWDIETGFKSTKQMNDPYSFPRPIAGDYDSQIFWLISSGHYLSTIFSQYQVLDHS